MVMFAFKQEHVSHTIIRCHDSMKLMFQQYSIMEL